MPAGAVTYFTAPTGKSCSQPSAGTVPCSMLSWLPCTAYQGTPIPGVRNGRRIAVSTPGTSGNP
jgi:hypothetical protein